jgi:hypothetical protein
MTMISNRFVLMLLVVSAGLAGCASESKPDYSGRSYLGTSFTSIESDLGEGWVTFNGDEDRMVFSRHGEGWTNHTLYESLRGEDGWTEPAVMPFSGTYNDRGARFYPALDAMLFSSDRPLVEGEPAGDFNIWLAMHDGEEWMAPEPMTALNSPANDFHASIAGDGNIYFASDREGGKGKSDIYRAILGRDGYRVEALGGTLNTKYSESDVFISEDSRFMIFSRTDDPNGLGGDDLWISFPSESGWGEPINLGPEVNSPEGEYGAFHPTGGVSLYFTTHRDGKADIVSVPMSKLVVDWPQN